MKMALWNLQEYFLAQMESYWSVVQECAPLEEIG